MMCDACCDFVFEGEFEEESKQPVLSEQQKHQLKHRELFLSRQFESLPATHIRYVFPNQNVRRVFDSKFRQISESCFPQLNLCSAQARTLFAF